LDIEKKEEKTILDGVDNARLSANGQKDTRDQIRKLCRDHSKRKPEFEKNHLALADMQMMVDPVQEWKQIFMDVWRFERDYFYDAGMHGVDWKQAKDRYLKMFEGAMTREEADFIIGELIGELNASHTYHGWWRYGNAKE
jgi:tricorn protease